MTHRSLLGRLATSLALLASCATPAVADTGTSPPLVVFAAASMSSALDTIAAQWKRFTGQVVRISYAGTSALARQLEQGAPADVFISADLDWMDYLSARKLVGEPTVLVGNRLVLIAPRDSQVSVKVKDPTSLAKALGDGRLAVANVDTVPAGRYAKAALGSLGLWDSVAEHLVQTDNVRAALRLVARGEAPLGIVYATDAKAEPQVRALVQFQETTHPPIRYLGATVSQSRNPQAQAFLNYLSSGAARGVFGVTGFVKLTDPDKDKDQE